HDIADAPSEWIRERHLRARHEAATHCDDVIAVDYQRCSATARAGRGEGVHGAGFRWPRECALRQTGALQVVVHHLANGSDIAGLETQAAVLTSRESYSLTCRVVQLLFQVVSLSKVKNADDHDGQQGKHKSEFYQLRALVLQGEIP